MSDTFSSDMRARAHGESATGRSRYHGCMNPRLFAAAALLLSLFVPAAALAQGHAHENTPAPGANPTPANTPKQPEEPKTLPEHLPADKSVAQTITVNGRTIHYTATVGTIALKAKDGKTTGEVIYTAYTVDPPKGAGIDPPRDLRVQRRSGCQLHLPELRRDRPQAHRLRERRRLGLRSRRG